KEQPCAAGWIGYEGKCYFFSEEEGNWTHGQNFCSSHGSFLARIETESEKVGLKKLSFSIILYVCVNHSQSSVDASILCNHDPARLLMIRLHKLWHRMATSWITEQMCSHSALGSSFFLLWSLGQHEAGLSQDVNSSFLS
uniref:Uncharacterized protein n=1 Tax=Varanus komodoensis TaxID=61221 RepID=A0A8D2Q6Y4_VARKO